jgi:hypothetical protein
MSLVLLKDVDSEFTVCPQEKGDAFHTPSHTKNGTKATNTQRQTFLGYRLSMVRFAMIARILGGLMVYLCEARKQFLEI